jgi:hypothetical protein
MLVAWNQGQVCIRSSRSISWVSTWRSDFLLAEVAADAAHGGESDRVVAAENDREGAAGEHVGDALGDLIEALFVVGRNREDVADIAKGDLFAQIHPHFVVVRGVQR